jgi:cell division transport system ATP-binding protein
MRIEVHNATVAYDGIPTLHDASLTIEPGSIVLCTGPTGAGKTTLLRLLYADLLPTSGNVSVDGILTSAMTSAQRRAMRLRQGIVQQSCLLVSDYTVFENVLMPYAIRGVAKDEAHRACLDLLADLNISYVRNKYPHQLSGGERHLVALARAVSSKPDMLIADEPTGTLDDATSAQVAQMLLSRQHEGMTMVISTHSQNFVNAFPKATICSVIDGVVTVKTPEGAQA